jgi:hypothetical protein
MRRRVSVLILVLGAAIAGACTDTQTYTCQPLCAGSNGGEIGGNDTITVGGASESDAKQACMRQEENDGSACPSGELVVGCSCDQN